MFHSFSTLMSPRTRRFPTFQVTNPPKTTRFLQASRSQAACCSLTVSSVSMPGIKNQSWSYLGFNGLLFSQIFPESFHTEPWIQAQFFPTLYWNRTSVEPYPYNLNLSWCDLVEKNTGGATLFYQEWFWGHKNLDGFKSYSTEWMTHLSFSLNQPDRVELGSMVRINGIFRLLINRVYWGCNSFTNHLLTSADIPSKSITKVLILNLLPSSRDLQAKTSQRKLTAKQPRKTTWYEKNNPSRLPDLQFVIPSLFCQFLVDNQYADTFVWFHRISKIYAASRYPWPSEIPHPSILFILPKLGAAQGPNGKNGKIHVWDLKKLDNLRLGIVLKKQMIAMGYHGLSGCLNHACSKEMVVCLPRPGSFLPRQSSHYLGEVYQ